MATLSRVRTLVSGEVSPPGDKSISHRSLMLGALGEGSSRIDGILDSADVRSTASVLRALGARIDWVDAVAIVAGRGVRGLTAPATSLDCGNSGTTARLVAGIVAGSFFAARLEGDQSLSRRPMRRLTSLLESMGARTEMSAHDGLPMTVQGGALRAVPCTLPVASAQLKSAVLLAGVVAGCGAEVVEPAPSRDHTERMLTARGAVVTREGSTVRVAAQAALCAADTTVPGDPSSAAFLAAFAAMCDDGELMIRDVAVNPGRIGFLRALIQMGASVTIGNQRDVDGEPVADCTIAPGSLHAIVLDAHDIPSLIDELPVLAIVAARAAGETIVRGAGELRAKESDRIATIVSNLRAVGADAEELPDGFVIRGSDAPLRGRVRTAGDHRIAMAFAVLAAVGGNEIEIDDMRCAAVSYPDFMSDLTRISR